MSERDNGCSDPADFPISSHDTPSQNAEAIGQSLAPKTSQPLGQKLSSPLVPNTGNDFPANQVTSLQDEGAEAHFVGLDQPLQRGPEFRHPLVPSIPTVHCLPSAFLESSSALHGQFIEAPQPDEAGHVGSNVNLHYQQHVDSDGFLQVRPHNPSYDSSEDEFTRSPGGRKHVDTLSDGPYLLTASRASFQGVPSGSHSAANKVRSPRTPRVKTSLPTTVRPLEPLIPSQSTVAHGNGGSDVPRGMKVLTTTLKDAIYDATSPSKQRVYAEKFKKSAPLPFQKKPKHKKRGAGPQEVPGEYSWWEKNSDDSDSTVDLDELDKGDPALKAVDIFRGEQAKQWQVELRELQWKQHATEQKSSGPPSNKKAWEKDSLLRNIKKHIQVKLQNDYVLILQKLPPAALKIKVTTCAHPFCSSPKGCSPAGSYRLSLEPVENLGDAKVPTVSLAEVQKQERPARRPTKEQNGQGANGATWYCLTCLEGLWNGVGQMTDNNSKKNQSTTVSAPRSSKKRRNIPGSRGGSLTPSSMSVQQLPPPGELPDLSNRQGFSQTTLLEEDINFGLDGTNDDLDLIPDRYRGPLSIAILKAAEQAGSMVSLEEKHNVKVSFGTPTKPKIGVRAGSAPITPSKFRSSVADSVSPSITSPEAYACSTKSTPEGKPFVNLSKERRASLSGDLQAPPLDSGYITEASSIELIDDKTELRACPRNCDTLSDRFRRQRQTDNILKALKGFQTIRTDASPATKKEELFVSPIKMQRRLPDVKTLAETEAFKAVKKVKSKNDGSKSQLPAIPDYYCTCHKPDDGLDMIKCCNELCLYGWFHLACTGLSKVPDDGVIWYCAACSIVFPKNKKRAPQAEDSDRAATTADEFDADPTSPQAMNLDGVCDSPNEVPQTHNKTAPSALSRPTSEDHPETPKTNPLKRQRSPSPHAPSLSPATAASTLSPFANDLSSFIYPETRAHSSGYYTLSPPQLFALQKWKSTVARQQMFENPTNRAFLTRNNLIHKYDESNPDAPLEAVNKAEDAPTRGAMKIGGLVVEVSAKEVRNKQLSEVMKSVDERVGRELDRLGYVDKPYKGNVTLKVAKKRVVEREGDMVSSGDEVTSSSDDGQGLE
ncbi:MAG: hypothetical protein M1836_001869 [Candelina mexicana]|nr:MAG: hypothetical protein M1836_001869 [Candelina mexicana]